MIDWAQVSQLREEIGAEAFTEVVAAFLTEVEDMLEALCLQNIANAHMEATYHALKGSALNLGLADFAGICSQAEVAARAGRSLPDPEWLRCVFRKEKTAFLNEMGQAFDA